VPKIKGCISSVKNFEKLKRKIAKIKKGCCMLKIEKQARKMKINFKGYS